MKSQKQNSADYMCWLKRCPFYFGVSLMKRTFAVYVYLSLIPVGVIGGQGTPEVGGNGKDTVLKVKIFGMSALIPVWPADDPNPVICADVEFILDLSCSISPDTKDWARNVSKAIGNALLRYDPKILKTRVGIMTYGQEVNRIKTLETNTSAQELMDIFDAIDVRKKQGDLCRTHTHLALQNAQETFQRFNRTNNQQIILLFTDGLTFLRRRREPMYVTKNELKDSEVILNVISLPHRKGKFDSEEYDLLPHSSDHLFNGTDNNIANNIIERMKIDAPCPRPQANNLDDSG